MLMYSYKYLVTISKTNCTILLLCKLNNNSMFRSELFCCFVLLKIQNTGVLIQNVKIKCRLDTVVWHRAKTVIPFNNEDTGPECFFMCECLCGLKNFCVYTDHWQISHRKQKLVVLMLCWTGVSMVKHVILAIDWLTGRCQNTQSIKVVVLMLRPVCIVPFTNTWASTAQHCSTYQILLFQLQIMIKYDPPYSTVTAHPPDVVNKKSREVWERKVGCIFKHMQKPCLIRHSNCSLL